MGLFYLKSILGYIVQMLPCMFFAFGVFFLVRPWRVRRLASSGLSSSFCREVALFLFVLFCAGLGALTLFPRDFWHWKFLLLMLQGKQIFAPINLSLQLQCVQWIPFQNMLSSDGQIGWGLFMLLGNIIMFAPLGFFSALLWHNPGWRKPLLVGFCSSFFVEVIQFFIGRGSDINDVILNSLGALCGFWLFCLLRRLFPHTIRKFQCIRLEDPYGREIGNPTASA